MKNCSIINNVTFFLKCKSLRLFPGLFLGAAPCKHREDTKTRQCEKKYF